ncbi:hypothetical protein F8M41_002863 [Gigaspora margarita]|uniref:Uncharacterized protein n=1 Tax=Gigaspora margarita TaxID=4874 RepID=A0A8H3XF66_GIGMA|nr:hypothetical protein F8M41_002863 [Gigaspora margarita]
METKNKKIEMLLQIPLHKERSSEKQTITKDEMFISEKLLATYTKILEEKQEKWTYLFLRLRRGQLTYSSFFSRKKYMLK